ncbi:MAG: metallophosphoesterase [Chthoniobacterales bacterium]
MRPSFLIFFAVVFTVYFSVQAYLFVRGWQALGWKPRWRKFYLPVFWFLALAFVAGRNLENIAVTPWSSALVWVGAFWFALMYYLLLGTLGIDIFGRILRRWRWLPAAWLAAWPRTKFRAALLLLLAVSVLVAWGHWNALHPKVVTMEVSLPSVPGAPPRLRVAVASDLHLGTLVTQARVKGWVDTINGLKPDLILLPGDVIDEDLPPVVENNLGDYLSHLRAPLGVYAVTGNHEYIGGVEAAVDYLEDHGVAMLRDRAVPLAGGALWLAGREDVSIARFRGGQRAPLGEILLGVPDGVPVVVMDHQPVALAEAAALGAALQVSGHTHDGQLWPNKYLVRAIFGQSSGAGEEGGMPFYILPGLGTWGPPVRVGNRPEILDLTLTFDQPPG